MSCSLRLLLPVMILAVPVAALAQSQPRVYPNLGTPLSQAEIQSFDRMIGPEGKELPPGRGTAKEGAEVFAKRCEICHGKGKDGDNGLLRSLVIGSPGKPYVGPTILDVALAPSGALELEWDNGKQVGVGQVLGNVLAVACSTKGRTVILLMNINSDGSLSGKSSRRTDRGAKGTEAWKRT